MSEPRLLFRKTNIYKEKNQYFSVPKGGVTKSLFFFMISGGEVPSDVVPTAGCRSLTILTVGVNQYFWFDVRKDS